MGRRTTILALDLSQILGFFRMGDYLPYTEKNVYGLSNFIYCQIYAGFNPRLRAVKLTNLYVRLGNISTLMRIVLHYWLMHLH